MNEQPGAIAARIAAVEQRLLVAVLQGDDTARSVARAEIARLKQQLLPRAPQQDGAGRSTRPAQSPVAPR